MADHHRIAEYFAEGAFFTEPGSPQQKPTVKNTNGLIRQYLPKHLSVARHESELEAIAARLNHRQRKTHNWRSPTEVPAAGFVQMAPGVASTT